MVRVVIWVGTMGKGFGPVVLIVAGTGFIAGNKTSKNKRK
jgi:hypothetical protein